MGILRDSGLLLQAQPTLFGTHDRWGTEGRSWEIKFINCVDASGAPMNMAALTGTCRIVTKPGGDLVATMTYAGAVGEFTLSATPAQTAGLAAGKRMRACRWGLSLSDGTDSLQVWGPATSRFYIETED